MDALGVVLIAVGCSLVAMIVSLWVLNSTTMTMRDAIHGRVDKLFDALDERLKVANVTRRAEHDGLRGRVEALDKRTLDDINAIAEHVGLDWEEPHGGRWVRKAASEAETAT